ncbi:MAG: branched-chain amino acid ABC transporter permease [Acidocella sp. 20-57-95]|nr:MAG: branched-chain amino acid ABC transporter permease [Acidocella sp. 20-57-95]OYV62121.1 MAG: branched-chain amino acid ABC transporter permease [Acidocella sp. 21-58-7]HQT63867.1 branched-chain amino acid ABC transporter permease [Acidocella sp.]HQU05143.1 branched-chain amino acid ABC transporter permease [Acidocella sp.]
MLILQILIDGFAISALYALGALGFTLIFGVSGVLNLAHGAVLVTSAMVAWYVGTNEAAGALAGAASGVLAGVITAFVTYAVVVRPIQRSKAIPEGERELFVLTGTLLWGVMLQIGLGYIFTTTPVTVHQLVSGTVDIMGVRTPTNEILIAVMSWLTLGVLWLVVNRTPAGKRLLAASINPRGLTLMGVELGQVYLLAWGIYGIIAGIAGVLLGSFLGTSSAYIPALTGTAFSIVVLGGLGSVTGTVMAAYVVGYIETLTAYLVSPSLRAVPALLLLVLVLYFRPQGILGRR